MKPRIKPFFHQTAADLMSPVVISVPREMSLQGAAHLLSQNHISGAPVVDEAGRCIGVLSSSDFVQLVEHGTSSKSGPRETGPCYCSDWQVVAAARDIDEGLHVQDVMTPDLVTAGPATSIGRLASMMMDAHIHRVIIVDATGRPLGIVSATDILAALARADRQLDPEAETPNYLADVGME